MIGDGSKIMMCDFFYGRIFTDLIDSPYSFFDKVDKLDILLHFPLFKSFGEKFKEENKGWINRRAMMGEKFSA